ncbi:MarR family transcriptional regulator, partial [Burkholderia gladioli]|nr:MarR family transcriptional regulator [Burkholderia gladioli]
AAFDACMPRRTAFLDETMSALPDEALNALSGALALLEARIAEVGAAPAEEPAGIDRNRSAA